MLVYVFAGESILLGTAGARQVQRDDSPRLFNIVEEMKLASGLPFFPKIYLIDDPAPNAFAIGRRPETSALAVTTGLMHRLDRDELQGVIAHEIGHLTNRDVQFMTLAAATLGTIVVLSEMVRRTLWLGGGRGRRRTKSRGGGGGGQVQVILLIVALVFVILGPLVAQLLYFACSRKREFLADASAAQFTRYPEGLASALEKIAGARTKVAFASKVTAPMFIVNPLHARGAQPSSLFSTHPPTVDRVRILRSMAGAGLADYEAAYRRARGGAMIGAGTLATAEAQTIRAPAASEPVQSRRDTRELVYRSYGYIRMKCVGCGLEFSVPERYERNDINCIRCGTTMPLPKVQEVIDTAFAQANRTPAAAALADPRTLLQFHRTGAGWESFRCACGRTVQLSPAFGAPHIRCHNCGRTIEVLAGPAG